MAEMTLSDRGILEIAEHEGIVPAPYRDSVGVWTWGIGHTRNAGGLDPAKMPMAMPGNLDAAIDLVIETFRDDVVKYAARVNTAIKVPLKQHEFDALVSFDLNTGGIHRAQLTKAINQGDPDAARHFMGWLRPPEIRERRKAEMSLFRTGDYDANGDTIQNLAHQWRGPVVRHHANDYRRGNACPVRGGTRPRRPAAAAGPDAHGAVAGRHRRPAPRAG